MWSSEGASVVPLLLVLALTGLQRTYALPQAEDGADHNKGRIGGEQEASPRPLLLGEPQSQPQPLGRQLREPRQRNLIEELSAMITAPYRGPVVTSMNAFLSRNTLSRPVRQSLRQQFREGGGLARPLVEQVNIPRPQGQRAQFGAPHGNGQHLGVGPPSQPQRFSGPQGQGQEFVVAQGQGQRFNVLRQPESDSPRLRQQFSGVQDQTQTRFSNQNSPQQDQLRFVRQPAQQPRVVQQQQHRQSKPNLPPGDQFPGFRSSPLQETGSALIGPGGSGFQPLTPNFQREDVPTFSDSQRREFSNPTRVSEKTVHQPSSVSATSAFSFENGVFGDKFESHRVKRSAQEYELISNAEGGYSVVPHAFGIHPSPKHDQRDQSQESYGFTQSIGNMISSWQESLPDMISDIRKMFRLDTSSENGVRSEERVYNDQNRVVISSAPLPVPFLVPQLPSKLILPNAPPTLHNGLDQDYQIFTPRNKSPEKSESKERSRREAQRVANNKRNPNRPPTRGHPGQVRLPPGRGQRVRPGPPGRGGPALSRPRPARQNQRPVPRPVRHGIQGQPIRVRNAQHRFPNHGPRQTKPHSGNVNIASHPNKEEPFPPTLAPESNFNDGVKDSHHNEIVEVNFADLPEETSVKKDGRLKQIEELIKLHNDEVHQSEEAKKSRNDPNQINQDRNQVVHGNIIIGHREQDSGVQEYTEQKNEVSRFDPNSENAKDSFREETEKQFQSAFGSNFPKFPQFDFMSNFNSDFENSFFGGGNDISHSVETKSHPRSTSVKPTPKFFKPSPKIPLPSQQHLTHQPTMPISHPNHLNPGPPHRFHHHPHPIHHPHPPAPFLGPATHIYIPDSPLPRRSKQRGGSSHSATAYVPGPAPLASILPRYSTVRAPVEIIRENLRIPRNTRQEDIVVVSRRKRDLDTATASKDRFQGGFDTPLARVDSDGFMQDREPMPDFASLGGFGPMAEQKANEEESQFRPHFEMPAFEVPQLDMKQPTLGPDSFPKMKDFNENSGKRERRSADAVRPTFGRGAVPDSEASNTNTRPQQQQPLVPFDSFPVFNFPTFGERNSREVAPRAVSFSNSGRSASQPRVSHVAPTGPHAPSFIGAQRPRSVEGHQTQILQPQVQQLHGLQPQSQQQQGQQQQQDIIFKAEPQRIYPSFNSGRNPYSRPPPPPATRSASNRTPFYPSPKIANGPKSRGSSNSFNTLPNGFRDFHETFYGNADRGESKGGQPGSSSHRQNDYAPVDNSLLGSGNFEVLSGGTFYEDEGYGNQRHPYDSFLDNGYNYNDGAGNFNQPHSNNYVDDFFSNFRDFSEFAVRRSDPDEKDDFFGHGSENIHKYATLSPVELKKLNFQSDPKKPDASNSSASASVSAPAKDISETTKPQPLDHPPRNIQEVMQQEEALPSNLEAAELSVDEKDPLIATY